VAGCCECGRQLLASVIKCGKFLVREPVSSYRRTLLCGVVYLFSYAVCLFVCFTYTN
jgi:hypothetical protein